MQETLQDRALHYAGVAEDIIQMSETLHDRSLFYAGAAGDALGRLKGILLWIQDEDVPRGKCVEQLKKLIAEHEEKFPEQKTLQS